MHDARFVNNLTVVCTYSSSSSQDSKLHGILLPNEILFFSQDGKTAVHHAVLGDPPKAEPSYEVVKLLLDSGGEANTADYVSAMGCFCSVYDIFLMQDHCTNNRYMLL